MDPGVHTPLVDFFRRGEVARDVRMLAARGAFAPRAHEQLALIAILVDDPDPEVREAAQETIRLIPREALGAFLARSDVPADLRDFFVALGIEVAAAPAPEADQPLIDTSPDLTADAALLEGGGEGEAARQTVTQKLTSANVVEKITYAMKGSREERGVLIRDPNRLVSAAVLSSPKMTEAEIESYAKNAGVSEDVLRIIGHNRAWMKNYSIAAALTRNSKTPLAISLNLMNPLHERDLKLLSTDRNIQEPLRLAAKRKVQAGEQKS